MTLSGEERDYAIQDIGELTGRSPEAVRAKMRAINWKRRQALMGHRAALCTQSEKYLAALEGRE
jgi:ribosomal protein L5